MPAQRSRLTTLLFDGHAAEVLIASEPETRFAAHWHETWSVGAIGSGSCRFACAGRGYHAQAGDVVVIPPYAVHTAAVSPQRFDMVMLYLPAQWVHGAMGWPQQQLPVGAAVARSDKELALMLTHAVLAQDSAGIAAIVVQALQRALPDKLEFAALEANEPRIVALCDALRNDAPQAPDMAVLARRAGMSREHFHRLFRKTIGLTPREYARLARMSQAKRLLREGSPIAQAAAECGFADQAHFSRWFRRYFGVTPAAYQA